MKFEEESTSEKQNDISQIRRYLSDMCEYVHELFYDYNIMSRKFNHLVYHLRQLDGAAIAQSYESLEGVCPTHADIIKYLLLELF